MTITADFSSGRVATTEPLYQWDTGQKLALSGLPQTASDIQVHFANAAMPQAIVKATELVDSLPTCDIPNEFLQFGSAAKARAWVYFKEGSSKGYTIKTVLIPITPRKRPNDYVSPEDPDSRGIVERAIELLENYQSDLDGKVNLKPIPAGGYDDCTESNTLYYGYAGGYYVYVLPVVVTGSSNQSQYKLRADNGLIECRARHYSNGAWGAWDSWTPAGREGNIADGAITENKLAAALKAVINAKAIVDTATQTVEYNANNPRIIYTRALVNSKNAIVLTTSDNYYQIALCYDGTEYKRELTAGGSTTYKPWALVNNENTGNKKNSITSSNKASTDFYPSIKAVVDYLAANYENLSNKLTSEDGIDSDSTDTEYPTAKAVFDFGVQIVDDFNENIMETNSNLFNLKERLDHTGAPTDEQVAEAVADYLDEHPGIIPAKGDGTSPLADKNIVVFGDSLTDPQSAGISWTESFINVAEYNSFRGYGRGWCTWTFKNNTEYNITDNTDANVGSNVIWNQFNKLKHDVDNNNTPIPDIIIIFCGANDALQSKTIGSESATFQANAQSSDVKTLTNMMDSIRYNIDTINAEYPNCIIVPIIPLLPPQYATSKTYRDALITCYNNLGLSYIDVMYGSGIAWYREVMEKTYFENDRIHLSEAGSMKVAKFIYQSLITMPRIQKLPSTTTNKGLYNVYYNFTNATSTNSFASVMQGEPYRAIISATTGYSLTSVTCTMGGVTQPVTGGLIDIANVTGDIRITAVGGSSTHTTYTVTNNLTNATNSNAATSVTEGDSYTATISANTGYRITSVTCTMGSTQQTVTNNTINIASVTGNIVITAVTEQDQPTVYYTVTNNLTNATNSNVAAFVEEGTAYTATISANRGHHMSSVTCTMDGVEQTVTDNTINIASVSGNIIITAVAESDFVPVEGAYIHNDGNCWVGTSYYPTRNTTKLELVANVHSFCGDWGYLVGSTSTKLCQWQNKDKVGCIAGDGMQYDENLVTVSYDKKFTLYADIANKVLTITDEDGTRTSEIRVGTAFVTNPMWYFAGYFAGNFEHKSGDMKVYSMKIWEGDTLVYEGYPINDVNGAGMYDTITGTTNYNEGTGTLTYGVDSVS